MDVAIAEAAASIARAVLDLMVRLQLEAFIAECWLARRGPLVRVVERDVVFVGRALRSSDCWHATATDRGTGRRLRVDVIKNASGEPRVYETATGLEQASSFILMSSSKDLRRALNVARLVVCERNRTTSAVTPGSFMAWMCRSTSSFRLALGWST